jgi:cyanophycin synthetase
VFDHIILRRDDDRRGRGADEVPRLMESALREAGVPSERVTVIVDEQQAIDAALKLASPGDLLVVFGDNITRSWKQIIYFKGDERAAAEVPVVARIAPRVEAVESQLDGSTVIADERGVRLARETDD